MTLATRVSMLLVLLAGFAPVACGAGSDDTQLDTPNVPSDAVVVTSGDLQGDVKFSTQAPIVSTEDGFAVQGTLDGQPIELHLASTDEAGSSLADDSVEKAKPIGGGGGGVRHCFDCTGCHPVPGGGVECTSCTEIPCPVATLTLAQ